MVIPYCLMWCIRRERNSRIFEDTESSMHDLKLFFIRTILNWLSANRNLSLFSIIDLIDLCNFCQYISCILGWLNFFLISIILLLIKKRKEKRIKMHKIGLTYRECRRNCQ